MFGFTKKTSQTQEENKNSPLNLSQQKNFNIEDTPIHTMREDLENLENPSMQHGVIVPQNNPAPLNLSQKQKSSPFLNLGGDDSLKINGMTKNDPKMNDENTLTFSQAEKKTPTASPFDQKNTQPLLKNSATPNPKLRLITLSIVSFLLIISLGWAGYSYLKTNSELQKQPLFTAPAETPVEVPPAKPTLSYSQENPNYLHLEEGSVITEKIKTTLGQVSQEGYASPVEFVITDAQNTPLSFKDFSGLLGLKLSPAVFALMGNNFSLFVYNDIAGPRTGIAIESRDDINLTKVLLSEEKNLANEISPLFFTSEYKTDKLFASSAYLDANIRYQNIISPDKLSVDYSVYKNKLLIGTTKLTLRSIIDKLSGAKTEVAPVTITPAPATTTPPTPPLPTIEKPTENSSN
ncbi:MAG: hypothetical protein NTY33_01530 [Candidatus Moranbacteria bacterium]|nr:hypothetical protein [Candidatus Moranbacteria bacterium]